MVILTQYKAQRAHIERELREKYGKKNAVVKTVVSSQGGSSFPDVVCTLCRSVVRLYSLLLGDEWDYVILSTVRSLPEYQIDENPSMGWLKHNLGFILDHNQINVAITRARKGLVVIGSFLQ